MMAKMKSLQKKSMILPSTFSLRKKIVFKLTKESIIKMEHLILEHPV